MKSIISSSTEINSMPMLMPAFSGMAYTGYGLPRNPANAVLEFANVFTRIPNHATPVTATDADQRNPRIMGSVTAIDFPGTGASQRK